VEPVSNPPQPGEPGSEPTQGPVEPVSNPPQPSEPGSVSVGNITLETDKKTFGLGDFVRVSGSINTPTERKTVRLDVYDPEGTIFGPFNRSYLNFNNPSSSSEPWPNLSDIQITPDNKGQFMYRFPVDTPVSGTIIKGIYKLEVTSEGMIGNTTFRVK
jgi:hypothetical protein